MKRGVLSFFIGMSFALTGCSISSNVKENIKDIPVIYEEGDNVYNIKLSDTDEINVKENIENIINFSDKTNTLFYEDTDGNINKYSEGNTDIVNIENSRLYAKDISFSKDSSLVVYDLMYARDDSYSDMTTEEKTTFDKYIRNNPIYLESKDGLTKLSENAELISITQDNEILFLEFDNETYKNTLYIYTKDNKKIIIDSGEKIEWAKWNDKFKKLIYEKDEDVNELYVWDLELGTIKIDEGTNIISKFKQNKVNMIDEKTLTYIKYNGNEFTLNVSDINGNTEEIESNVDSIGIYDTREAFEKYIYYVPENSSGNQLLCYNVKSKQIEEISNNFKSGHVYDDRIIFIENDGALYEKNHEKNNIVKVSDNVQIDSNTTGNEFLYLDNNLYYISDSKLYERDDVLVHGVSEHYFDINKRPLVINENNELLIINDKESNVVIQDINNTNKIYYGDNEIKNNE